MAVRAKLLILDAMQEGTGPSYIVAQLAYIQGH